MRGKWGPLRERRTTGRAELTAPGGTSQEGKGGPDPRAGMGGFQDVRRARGSAPALRAGCPSAFQSALACGQSASCLHFSLVGRIKMLSKQKKKYYSWDMAQLCCLYVHMQEKGFEKNHNPPEGDRESKYLQASRAAAGLWLPPSTPRRELPPPRGLGQPQVDSPAPPCTSFSAQWGGGACPR